jgi:tetratricopeptide (TPR) repeat protein
VINNDLIEFEKEVATYIVNNQFKVAKVRLEQFFTLVEQHRASRGVDGDFFDTRLFFLKGLYAKALFGLKTYGTAAQALLSVEEHVTKAKSKKKILEYYSDIAYAFLNLKQYDKTFEYAKKVFDLAKRDFFPDYLVSSIEFMTLKLFEDKEYKKIDKFYKELDVIYGNMAIGDRQNQVNILKLMLRTKKADLAIAQGKLDKAKAILKKTSKIISRREDLTSQQIFQNLVKALMQSFITLAEHLGHKDIDSIKAFILKEGGIDFDV